MATRNDDKRSRQQRAEQMRKQRERAEKRRRNMLTVGIVVVVVVLIVAAGFAIKSQVDKNNGPAVTPNGLTKDGGVVYDQKAATGKAATNTSPVDVVLYEDFQCPVCKAFEQVNASFLQQQVTSGAISIEYRPIAFLDNENNNEYSTRALNASMCVYEDKGAKAYQAFLNLLYPNQPDESTGSGLPDAQLADYAEQAGAASGVSSCINSGTYEDWAATTTDRAFKSKDSSGTPVQGTPAVWVNGKVVEGAQGNFPVVNELQAAIAAAAK